jgi:hypothetical protein
MPTVVLRPNDDSYNAMVLPKNRHVTRAFQVTRDDSDDSFIYSTNTVHFYFDTFTLPADCVTVHARISGRGGNRLNDPDTPMLLSLFVQSTFFGERAANVDVLLPLNAIVDWSGPWAPVDWSQVDIDTIEVTYQTVNEAPRLYELAVDVVYAEPPTVTDVSTPSESITISPTIEWTHVPGTDGALQSHFRVRVFTPDQFGIVGFDPALSPASYDSGVITSSNDSAVVSLSNLTDYRAYVRTAQAINGTAHWAVEYAASNDFTIDAPTDEVVDPSPLDSSFTFTDLYRPVCHAFRDGVWTDLSCQVQACEIQRGRERFADRFAPATMSITFDNRSGWADLSGTPAEIKAMTIRPGREIRVGIEGRWGLPDSSVESVRWLFRGFVDVVQPAYDPVVSDSMTAECIDALGEVGVVKLPTLGEPGEGANETADVRVHRILNEADWPPERRVIDGSAVTLVATKLGSQALDELGKTADSAGGALFGNMDGGVTYRDRDWMLWGDVPPDATIGNIDDDDVCPSGFEESFDRSELTTQVEIGRTVPSGAPAEKPVLFSDDAAINRYGMQPFSRTDLLCANPQQMFPVLADRWFATRGVGSMPRVSEVTLDAATGTPYDVGDYRVDPVIDLMATCAPERPSRYRCRLKTHSGRQVFDRMMFATSVRHSISRNSWSLRIGLDLADWSSLAGTGAAPTAIDTTMPGTVAIGDVIAATVTTNGSPHALLMKGRDDNPPPGLTLEYTNAITSAITGTVAPEAHDKQWWWHVVAINRWGSVDAWIYVTVGALPIGMTPMSITWDVLSSADPGDVLAGTVTVDGDPAPTLSRGPLDNPPPGISTNYATGEITGTVADEAGDNDYVWQVVAQNRWGSISSTRAIHITGVAPTTITWAAVPTAVDIGELIEGTVAANGAPGPVLSAGGSDDPPPGVVIDYETGLVTGVVAGTAETTYTLHLVATNTSGTVDDVYTVDIGPLEAPATWLDRDIGPFTAGTPVRHVPDDTLNNHGQALDGNPRPILTLDSGLPAGMYFDADYTAGTGDPAFVLYGMPTTAGTTTLSITATNSEGSNTHEWEVTVLG